MAKSAALIDSGEILLTEVMDPYRLAKELHAPQPRIHSIMRGKRAISADTAVRLGIYFDLPAQFRLNLQKEYDLRSAADPAHAQIKATRCVASLL